jgi:hypothetical protein
MKIKILVLDYPSFADGINIIKQNHDVDITDKLTATINHFTNDNRNIDFRWYLEDDGLSEEVIKLVKNLFDSDMA